MQRALRCTIAALASRSDNPGQRTLSAARALLQRPRGHLLFVALAVLLCALHGDPLMLFRFTTGRPEDNHALMDQGALLPWWSDPQHLNAFLRPLSSLSHVLDFELWPHSSALMHLQSLLWFGALLLVLAHVYKRLHEAAPDPGAPQLAWALPLPVLALALFALDDAHGMTVAWLANRNALIAATLAFPALAAHHRWLALGYRPGALLGPFCFALGLCAGEAAVAVLGYLLAYTLVMDRAPWTKRLLHVAPYLLLMLCWRGLFGLLSLGSFGSSGYHDPGREPLAYARALLLHLPVLLGSELALPLADLWFWGPPALRVFVWVVSALSALAVLALAHRLLARDREARFWLFGMVLSACAVAASVPGERLLLVPSVGGAALIARVISRLAAGDTPGEPVLRGRRFALGALVLMHLLAAPLMLPVRALHMGLLARVIDRADASLESTEAIRQRAVIVLNAPVDMMVSYLQVARQARGVPRPSQFYWLATASSELRVERIDDHTLRVRPAKGFLHAAPERHYRANSRAMPAGSTVELSQMTARVIDQTEDGRPAAVDFRFREPLASSRYLFVRFERGLFVPADLPPASKTLTFPSEDLLEILSQEPVFGR
jgi:hypothetical protein